MGVNELRAGHDTRQDTREAKRMQCPGFDEM